MTKYEPNWKKISTIIKCKHKFFRDYGRCLKCGITYEAREAFNKGRDYEKIQHNKRIFKAIRAGAFDD